MTLRKIKLKYEGRCRKCGLLIPTGTSVYWEPKEGVWHLECGSDRQHGENMPSNAAFVLDTPFAFERREKRAPQPQFELYKDNVGKYRWRLRAPNGEIIAASEAYQSKEGAEKGIESVRRAAPKAMVEDLLGSTPSAVQPHAVWHEQREFKPPSGRPGNRIMALTVLFVLSALTFGYSLGNLGVFRSLPAPVTVHVTEIQTVTLTSEIRAVSPSVSTTLGITSTQKWANPNAPVISYLDAGKYIGQTKTVEGKIVITNRYEPGNIIFLDFHDPYQGYFMAIIWRENWKNFPFAPEIFYRGKEVRVTGLIKDYRGSPEIEVTGPKQIEVAYMGFSYPAPSVAFCVPAPITRNIQS